MEFPASYYGDIDRRNPVILAFEREVSSFLTLMKRFTSTPSQDNSSYARGVKLLVGICSKYKHRLPSKLYQEHMLHIADFLFGIKLYNLALWHGYTPHLQQFSSVDITDVTDLSTFMACFFPEGFDTDQHTLNMKFRALQGCYLCIFEQEKKHDVLSQAGLCRLLCVLNFIRVMMQALQQHEHLCWQLYNGSLHIYNICRYLMTMNFSAQVLEFLLWASISVELSIPLMTVKYLPWMVTLYCAVCQCYYDIQAAVQAEVFARRALGKINELAKLEEQSGVPATRETQRAYKEASIKLATMLFKRAVYEPRKRPKGMFRAKTKGNLKDIPNVPWPRTTTEHVLIELYDSSAAQFLGILEALWDSSRRPLQTGMPDEPELQEVVLELLSAGISILGGIGGASEQGRDDRLLMSLSKCTSESTLMELALSGENKVSFMSAVKFIKLLFHYEQFDVFTALARAMLQLLPDVEGMPLRKAELELALLDSFNSFQSSERIRFKEDILINERHKSEAVMSAEFITLVDTLHKSVCGSALEVQPDRDLILDVVLFLWCRIKPVFQRTQFQHWESKQDLGKQDHHHKWVWCLFSLCEVASVSDLVTVDCIVVAEMTLRLAMLLESTADSASEAHGVKPNPFSPLESSITERFQKVCEVVERGRDALARGWDTLLTQNGSAITDSTFLQTFKPGSSPTHSPLPPASGAGAEENGNGVSEKREEELETMAESEVGGSHPTLSMRLSLLATDLHLELVTIQHRVSLKSLQFNPVLTEPELLEHIRKNKVSKALFLMQKALLLYNNMEPSNSSKTKMLLEEALTLIEKAGVEERKLYNATTCPNETSTSDNNRGKKEGNERPPPPPILLSRTDHSLTFTPAPYNMEEQVCWYQLCGRTAKGVNLKVRLGDCSLPGTGNLVPALHSQCKLTVEGLEPNQKYVFAVAAYNCQGKLVGSTIGETTDPIVASLPLPLLTTWAHLAQVAFQTQQYTLAKRACRELWSHYTHPNPEPDSTQGSLALTRLRVQTLQHSSSVLLQLFLTSIFIETEINIQQGALYCDSVCDNGPLIWGQEARLAECDRMLVAMDLAMWMNDSGAALQATVGCYGLLAPLIFHQITCEPVVQVLTKCLILLEENSAVLKQKHTEDTSGSLMHMIACITYYLSKALRVLREYQMASVVMTRGRKLLQEVYESQLQLSRLVSETEGLKALHVENERGILNDAASTSNSESSPPHELTGLEDPVILYNVITISKLKCAYRDVMKFRHKLGFTEFAALLLQRTMEEDQPEQVIQWGQNIFEYLSRRDESLGLRVKIFGGKSHNINSFVLDLLVCREMQAEENLLKLMAAMTRCHQKRLQQRSVCCEERVWRSQLNHSMAQAHIALLHKTLDRLHGAALQHSYSQFNPLFFSLAHSGVLVRMKNSNYDVKDNLLAAHKAISGKGSVTVQSCTEGQNSSQTAMPQAPNKPPVRSSSTRRSGMSLLDSLNRAALHFRRAMVLAHRGGHWTTLRCVCQTLWDQGCRITALVQRAAQLHSSCPISVDQLHTTLTPLLVLATDLLLDMLDRLGLWSVYDSDVGDEELEASLRFSAPLDHSNQVDLRWVRTLVLYTLQLLHDRAKWETLVHFALLFNSYTRERYTLTVTPLQVHAQRRLLERITTLGGPSVPQPHHVKTQKATGKEITCRSYAGCQLLSGWTPYTKTSSNVNNSTADVLCVYGAEIQRSMCLVCVPLDVEDTLRCYRQALEKRLYCLQTFQHSRSLLLLLLAHTQPFSVAQLRQGSSPFHSPGQVGFSPVVTSTPELQPQDLAEEDFSTLNALYSLPIGPKHTHSVITAYSTSIKYLQANSHNSLRVQALRDIGNLHFYNRNTRAAHSYWCKAIDCALLSTDVLEKWDGVSWGGGSLQHSLKLTGIWGCLQAAVLAAKIAQYTLTSDIGQRTKCCLLSAHLFKCVLCCSLPQPQCDLHYASHILGDELLPGVDIFAEPHRLNLGSTVSSLSFLCYWLYTTRHYITLLPMLALYLHFSGTVCQDVQRTAEGKILKIRTLTELSLFAEAIKETVHLTQGKGIPRAYGHNICIDNPQPVRRFYSNKSLLDNAQVLADIVNCDLAPEVRMLLGSTLCHRWNLARIQLVLTLTSTIHSLPWAESVVNTTRSHPNSSVHHEEDGLDTEENRAMKRTEPKVLVLDPQRDKLTPEKIKFLLLESTFPLLNCSLQQLLPQSRCKNEDLEMTIEASLLMANLYLQQGHAALSSDMAVSALVLLHMSPVIMVGALSSSQNPASPLPDTTAGSEQGSTGSRGVFSPLPTDCPRAVEACERTGAALWLHCRLALVRSLAAHIPGTAIFPGKDSNEEAARVLKEGLEESALWGDPDTQALLLLEGAALEAQRGQPKAARISMLQEAVSLLSGRTCMPPGSGVTLAQATLLLGDLRGTHSTTLLELTQKLLQQQLCVFGENVVLEDGQVCFPPPGPSNIYLPHLPLLAKVTMRIGHTLAVKAIERPVSALPSLSHLNTSSPTGPSMVSPFQIPRVAPSPDVVQAWHDAHKVLQSALTLSQFCAYRNMQLEADLLYCRGVVERSLRYLSKVKRQEVAGTFLGCIQTTMTHCHNLPLIRNCYLELALLFLHDWQHIPHKPLETTSQNKISHWKRLLLNLNRGLTVREGYLLLFWTYLRGAAMVLKAMSACSQLCGAVAGGESLSEMAVKALPIFAGNDLLNPCGGVDQMSQDAANQSPEAEQSLRALSLSHLTWTHVARYYIHLLNLQKTESEPVCTQIGEGLASLPRDASPASRLSQLHNFLCSHMTSYRENCCAPEPAPAEIILLPQIVQLSPALRACLGQEQEDEVYRWSISSKQQLCMQWHQPALSPAPGYQDIVFLLYGHNRHPVSATRGSTIAVMGLQCGQHVIKIERAKAVHAQLCELCVTANMTLSVAASFHCTSNTKTQKLNETSKESPNQHMQMLKEKILSCCLSIKDLLQSGSKSDPLTEVPFEITLESLRDLERCFNPAGGAIVDASSLTDWILSVLTHS
ncbi:cilia- and flagella-associated protein 54 [Myripristis murdjan]|uniref:cilia- and flagella-associated protein 54 n=1 Tax=Myripristis murdjan TaxID=586833 RepID=UPI0011760BC3|nr:cilia- and flagella-associated protein 54 [Myripristis murdjan]